MPEIGEVGKILAVVKAQEDANVFGKVGTSAGEFEKALKGKKVVGARQQGKYFCDVEYPAREYRIDLCSVHGIFF
ncbi:MAG: hypothetical protein Q9174_001296 [Haloplaca sp. 1 TL-2023]